MESAPFRGKHWQKLQTQSAMTSKVKEGELGGGGGLEKIATKHWGGGGKKKKS